MKSQRTFGLIGLLLLSIFQSFGQSDSLISDTVKASGKLRKEGFISTSYFSDKNWKSSDQSFLIFSGNINLSYLKVKNGLKRIHELNCELSYLKFIDSVWVKKNDQIFISSIWIAEQSKKIRNSFAVNFKTQMTDTWDENQLQTSTKRIWKSGPMLPAAFTAGFGINIKLWATSYINLSFAAIKVKTFSRKDDFKTDKKIIAKTEKAYIQSEYGFNIQSSIEKHLLKSICWENKTILFGTGIDKEEVVLNMENAISFKVLRVMKIRFSYRIDYDISIRKELQKRFEMLMGYYFDR